MMGIPFFLVVAALATAWSGYRRASVLLCAAGLFALLQFRLHATAALTAVVFCNRSLLRPVGEAVTAHR
jgi:hypothetical protein